MQKTSKDLSMIYYCYRQTENWLKNKISNFWYLKSTNSYEKLCKYIEIWNNKNKLTYFEFRQILKKASEEKFRKCNIKKIEINEILDLNPEDWIIPFDDDDWFCDSFKSKIENAKENFLYGDIVFYNIHTGDLDYKDGSNRDSLFSCQYCIRIESLKKINKSSLENIIQYHYLAKKEALNNNITIKHIPEIFAARIFHMASTDNIVRNNFLTEPKIYFQKKMDPKCWCSVESNKIKKIIKNKYL